MDYKILTSTDREELETEVMEYIDAGWYVSGGVSVSSDDEWDFYAQAVMRVREK